MVFIRTGSSRSANGKPPELGLKFSLISWCCESHFFTAFTKRLPEELDVLGKHGEEATLEESGSDLGIVAVLFEGLGEFGERLGDLASDLGSVLGGIERMGI